LEGVGKLRLLRTLNIPTDEVWIYSVHTKLKWKFKARRFVDARTEVLIFTGLLYKAPFFASSQIRLHNFFYVSLTVHHSITLANDQLDAQIFNTFITILYMYMFRAISCSFSGGQIVLIQHLISSLSVSDRPVHLCNRRCHNLKQKFQRFLFNV